MNTIVVQFCTDKAASPCRTVTNVSFSPSLSPQAAFATCAPKGRSDPVTKPPFLCGDVKLSLWRRGAWPLGESGDGAPTHPMRLGHEAVFTLGIMLFRSSPSTIYVSGPRVGAVYS